MFLFCERTTKRSRTKVKVSKSSITTLFDKLEFVYLLGIVNGYTDWSIAHNKDHGVLQFL